MARLTDEERLKRAEAKEAAAKAERVRLQGKISSKKRKDDNRRKIIVGATALAHAEHDPVFAEKLNHILDRHVMRENDRAFLGLKPKTNTKSAKTAAGKRF